MIGVGESITNTRAAPLLIFGNVVPPSPALIHATLTYGALGTCQGASLKLAQTPSLGYHADLWTLGFAAGGAQFAGIVENAIPSPGSLTEVRLAAPHRATLDALGAQIGSPYTLQTFGLPVTGVGATERLSDVLTRILEPYPTADYGVGPELTAGIGLPNYGTPVTLQAGDALSVRPLGYAVADYVTDALFDPGEGWEKWTYKRNVDPYVPRRTAAATADPMIVERSNEWGWFRQDVQPGTLGPAVPINSLYADGVQRRYSGHTTLAQTGPHYQVGRYAVSIAANSIRRRNKTFVVSCPFTLTGLETIDPAKTIKSPELIVQMREDARGAVGSYTVALKPSHIGLQMTARFEVSTDVLKDGIGFTLDYLLDNDYSNQHVDLILHPTKAILTHDEPNFGAVAMPPGWTAPVATGPIYELTFAGWHKPPLMIAGLPPGSQLAAGSVVEWNKNECKTTVTTMAWPYAGQRRR